jgi:hypothetical protein
VGVYYGTTTLLLAHYGTPVAVDWFKGNPEVGPDANSDMDGSAIPERLGGFKKALSESPVSSRVTVLTGKSDDILPLLKNDRFGLVLIDANHDTEFCYRDICNTWDLIASGGWLLLDDFSFTTIKGQSTNSVRRAWERFDAGRGLNTFTCDAGGGPKLVGIQKP